MISCIKDKCLKYPICQNKEFIECMLLVNSITDIRHKKLTTPQVHKIIRSAFPSLLQAKGYEFIAETASWRYIKYDILMPYGEVSWSDNDTRNSLISFEDELITGELANDTL